MRLQGQRQATPRRAPRCDEDALTGAHRDVRGLDCCRVRQRYRSNTVIMNGQALTPDTVCFLGLMDFDLAYQLIEHPRCELTRTGVLAHS